MARAASSPVAPDVVSIATTIVHNDRTNAHIFLDTCSTASHLFLTFISPPNPPSLALSLSFFCLQLFRLASTSRRGSDFRQRRNFKSKIHKHNAADDADDDAGGEGRRAGLQHPLSSVSLDTKELTSLPCRSACRSSLRQLTRHRGHSAKPLRVRCYIQLVLTGWNPRLAHPEHSRP